MRFLSFFTQQPRSQVWILKLRIWPIVFGCPDKEHLSNLPKRPFLLATRRWGRFARKSPQRRRARRNGCFRRLTSIPSRINYGGDIVSEYTTMDLHPTQGWARKRERGRGPRDGPGDGPGRGGMRRSYSSYRKQKPKLILLKVPNPESTISL